MAFNGTGTFARIYSWASDKANGIKILASRFDAELDGVATGLSNCVTKDGQTTTTARIPFAAGVSLSGTSTLNASGVLNVTADGGVTARDLKARLNDGGINVRDYGATGLGVADDYAAINLAIAAAAAGSKIVYFPPGIYRCSNGIDLPADVKLKGSGAPVLAPFPLNTDHKRFLRPGYKHLMPGSNLLFTGTGAKTGTTQRGDRFSSFTYCIKTTKQCPASIEGMGIILDCDVYDAGGTLTSIAGDNRASYDVGYWIEDSTECYHSDLVIFGYFAKAGLLISSKETAGYEGDPDYNEFFGGSTMGDYGVALVGSESNDGFDSGLSGTQFFGFSFFAKDHHSRDDVTDDWGDSCIFIDGHTDASAADINGHYFYGGNVRSYCNNPVNLDLASNVYFSGTVFETPKRGTVNSLATQFLATSNTRSVFFVGCRFSDGAGLYTASQFSNLMSGKMIVVGGNNGEIAITETGHTVRLLTAGGATGDPRIQFTTTPSSTTSGWQLLLDTDAAEEMDWRYAGTERMTLSSAGLLSPTALDTATGTITTATVSKLITSDGGTKTIAAGVITVTHTRHAIETEGATATDDLTTINGGTEGMILVLRSFSTSRFVICKDGTGNMRLAGDCALANAQDRLMLIYDGTNWCEMGRSQSSTDVTLTIATGAVTATRNYHPIDTEAAAATDDLDTISGGYTGQILVLRAANSSRDVVCKDGTGNLQLSADFTLTNIQDRITLIFDGTNWCELARSDNAV